VNNIGGESRFIGFFDECGDHSMEKIDKDFPLFVLALVVFERRTYVEKLIPAVGALKLRYWIHEGVNLHSREIRKQLGPFAFLHHPEERARFMQDVSQLIANVPFTLFVSAVRKLEHKERCGAETTSPYDLALEFTMERVRHFLRGENETTLPVVAEARGKNEDMALERVFLRILSAGTRAVGREEFQGLNCPLVFRSKQDNIAGVQVADLCAYPCARHVLDATKANPAFEVVKAHFYAGGAVIGLHVHP
jgi:hypothetical protein